jgi:hypothetical protein
MPSDYEEEGWFYDASSQLFYQSEEHFRKVEKKTD